LCLGSSLDDPGFESRRGQKIFIFSKTSILVLGPTQTPLKEVLWFFPGVKAPGHEVDRSPPSSTEVKNKGSFTLAPHTCIHGVQMDNFALLFLLFADIRESLCYFCGLVELLTFLGGTL